MVSLLEFWSLFVFVAFHAQFYVVEVGVESLTDQGVLDKPLLALAFEGAKYFDICTRRKRSFFSTR